MSQDNRLLSVAEIARRLGVPESTVHYWKNRFAQHLPSQGAGRQKRFRAEAVEVFAVIAEMFSLGHSAQDVMDALGKRFPLSAALSPGQEDSAPALSADSHARLSASMAKDMAREIGQEIGQEIARSIGEGLRLHLSAGGPQAALPAPLPAEDLEAIRCAVDESCSRLDAHAGEVTRMAQENAELKEKLSVLEAELVRLRRDRREMEKYLLDKIKSMST